MNFRLDRITSSVGAGDSPETKTHTLYFTPAAPSNAPYPGTSSQVVLNVTSSEAAGYTLDGIYSLALSPL